MKFVYIRYESVELFESPVLKAIIHHKWDASCRFIFFTTVFHSLNFTVLLTAVIVNDGANNSNFLNIARWYCLLLVALLIKYQLR